MRTRTSRFLAFLIGSCSLAPALLAGEVIFSEDFDKTDLPKLQTAPWNVTAPADLSIADEPNRGKVLRINGKGNGWPSLSYTLDLAKVRGKKVRVAAAAKFPGNYTPLAGKDWARPKLQLIWKEKGGKDRYAEAVPQPNTPDWQNLETSDTIDKEAESAVVFIRVDLVAADVYFDNFICDVDSDGSKPATPATPATPANPANPPVANNTPPAQPGKAPAPPATPAAPVLTGPAAIAAKAPKKTLDDGGVTFGPEIAAALQKSIKPSANKNTFALVGPGLPIKELETKTPEKWTKVAMTKETSGPLASPRNLLAVLPKFIAETKPEVVFIFGETAPTARKVTHTEHYDWEDLAKVCIRLGVIPVLAVPAAQPPDPKATEPREDLRAVMLTAAGDANCPVIDLKAPTQIPRRVAIMVDYFDKYVFCRVEPETPTAGTVKKPDEE
ncbi:MAG TPA: hypothetical protein VEK08_15605 [Planctomycetota bacterium]|nr:hypothetical protein [Planctomycetota bacterium]